MYLFIFLKFISSIIPTINYDFTMDVTASTQ
jgi:ubiquitin-like-conjugating enzyme ATG3